VLSYLLSALSLARHAVALTLVAGAAATTMVAGSVDQIATQPQHQMAQTTLAPTNRPETTENAEATLTVSAKSATQETTTRPATSTTTRPATSPTPEARTHDIEALVKDCLAKYAAAKTSTTAGTAASEACRRATLASGLTSTEFWAHFAPKTQPSTATVKPTTDPTNVEALARYCLSKYTAAKDNATEATAASEVCRRAIEASGLSATEFWAKFGKPQAPKTEPKTTAAPTATGLTQLTRYCLTMHAALTTASSHEQVERATTVCNQAIAESRLTPTEFWAKFSTYR
jgi:hypothetical protein